MRAEQWVWGLLLALLAGCAAPRAPLGYRADATQMQVDLRGSWVVVRKHNGDRFQGELLAVDADSLVVLAADGVALRQSWNQVRKARLEAWLPRTGRIWGMYGVGTALSLGTGWFALLTAPLWHATAAGILGDYTHRPVKTARAGSWQNLAPFARFPAGWPPGLDARRLTLLPPPREAVAQLPVAAGEALTFDYLLPAGGPEVDLSALSFPGRWERPPFPPARLPGAWMTGCLEAKRRAYPFQQACRVAGVLVAVTPDSLHLWSGGLRSLARRELPAASLHLVQGPDGLLNRRMRIRDDRRVDALRWAWFPAGLPALPRAALEDSLRRRLETDARASAWLKAECRWP